MERRDTHIWMAKSLSCPPDTITTLLTSYNPMQNKKLKKRMSTQGLCPGGSGYQGLVRALSAEFLELWLQMIPEAFEDFQVR